MSTKQHDETEVCDAGFTAADMATASAQGFRDGQASQAAAMLAGGEPVGYIITNTLVAGDRAIVFPDKADRAPKIFPRTPVYTHPQLAAQDAEDAKRYRWLRNPTIDVAQVLDKRTAWVPPDDAVPGVGGYWLYEYRAGDELDAAIDAAIAAQQGDSNE